MKLNTGKIYMLKSLIYIIP